MRVLAVAPLSFLALFFVVPMAVFLAGTAGAWDYLAHPYVRLVLRSALLQAAASTLLTLALALPLAWHHHARQQPFSRLQMALHAAPFVMPVFVVVYGLQEVAGRGGWLDTTLGLDVLGLLGPFGAVVLAHAVYNYGFAARILEAALQSRPRRMEEAARTLGAGPRGAFVRVTLPILLPAALAVALLVFLFTFGSYGVVLFLGEGHVHTLETAMAAWVAGGIPDFGRAGVLGALQLAVNGLLLVGYVLLRRRMARIPAEPAIRPRRASPLGAAVGWAATLLAVLPVAAVLVGGFRAGGSWSLEPWRHLLSGPAGFDLGRALALSLFYAGASTLLALLLAACLAYGARHLRVLRRPAEALAGLPMAGSGVLLGAAFLAAFGAHGLADLSGTVWIVLAAHTVLAFPFVARLLLPAFEAVDPALEESARLLGASRWAIPLRVHWPAMRPAILAAAGLAAALSLADFGATSLLSATDTRGLAVWIPIVEGNPFDPVGRGAAVALAGLLCALTLAAYLAVERVRVGVGR